MINSIFWKWCCKKKAYRLYQSCRKNIKCRLKKKKLSIHSNLSLPLKTLLKVFRFIFRFNPIVYHKMMEVSLACCTKVKEKQTAHWERTVWFKKKGWRRSKEQRCASVDTEERAGTSKGIESVDLMIKLWIFTYQTHL